MPNTKIDPYLLPAVSEAEVAEESLRQSGIREAARVVRPSKDRLQHEAKVNDYKMLLTVENARKLLKKYDDNINILRGKIVTSNKPEDKAELERLLNERKLILKRNTVMRPEKWDSLRKKLSAEKGITEDEQKALGKFKQYHIDNVPLGAWPEGLKDIVYNAEYNAQQRKKLADKNAKALWDALKTNEERANYILAKYRTGELPDYIEQALMADNFKLFELVMDKFGRLKNGNT